MKLQPKIHVDNLKSFTQKREVTNRFEASHSLSALIHENKYKVRNRIVLIWIFINFNGKNHICYRFVIFGLFRMNHVFDYTRKLHKKWILLMHQSEHKKVSERQPIHWRAHSVRFDCLAPHSNPESFSFLFHVWHIVFGWNAWTVTIEHLPTVKRSLHSAKSDEEFIYFRTKCERWWKPSAPLPPSPLASISTPTFAWTPEKWITDICGSMKKLRIVCVYCVHEQKKMRIQINV